MQDFGVLRRDYCAFRSRDVHKTDRHKGGCATSWATYLFLECPEAAFRFHAKWAIDPEFWNPDSSYSASLKAESKGMRGQPTSRGQPRTVIVSTRIDNHTPLA